MISTALTAPKFRHFFPTAFDFSAHTPASLPPKGCIHFDMSEHLLQGANPFDTAIINPAADNRVQQFQGGYRCILEIVTPAPAHTGRVVISEDRLGFDFYPAFSYQGISGFVYQITNVMGQYSDYAYVKLFVRC